KVMQLDRSFSLTDAPPWRLPTHHVVGTDEHVEQPLRSRRPMSPVFTQPSTMLGRVPEAWQRRRSLLARIAGRGCLARSPPPNRLCFSLFAALDTWRSRKSHGA